MGAPLQVPGSAAGVLPARLLLWVPQEWMSGHPLLDGPLPQSLCEQHRLPPRFPVCNLSFLSHFANASSVLHDLCITPPSSVALIQYAQHQPDCILSAAR